MEKQRVQISRDDFLKSFETHYNNQEAKPLEKIPQMMDREMRDKQPLMHLFSKYVIRPNAFDRDPFVLPKAAQQNKHYYFYHTNSQNKKYDGPQQPSDGGFKRNFAQDEQEPTSVRDDFETVEAPKKKVRPAKPAPVFQADGTTEVAAVLAKPEEDVKVAAPIVKESTIITRPQTAAAIVKETAPAEVKQVTKPKDEPLRRPTTATQQPQAQAPQAQKKKEQTKAPTPKVTEAAPVAKVEEVKQPEPVPEKPVAQVADNLKGPKPKGTKKFKSVKTEEPATPVEELSENQKRKQATQLRKQEAEEQLKADEAAVARQKTLDAERERKRAADAARSDKQKQYEDEQKKKCENMFKDLHKAPQAEVPAQKQAKRFEDVMADDEKMDAKRDAQEKKRAAVMAAQNTGMTFDWNDPYKASGKKQAAPVQRSTQDLFGQQPKTKKK